MPCEGAGKKYIKSEWLSRNESTSFKLRKLFLLINLEVFCSGSGDITPQVKRTHLVEVLEYPGVEGPDGVWEPLELLHGDVLGGWKWLP